jgi:hypothetical protein
LKELWGSISDVSSKVYSGIDERTAKTLESIQFPVLKEEPLKFKAVNVLFLPEEVEDIRQFMGVLENLPGDEIWLASVKHYRDFFGVLVAAKGAFDVVNTASAMLKLVEVAKFALGAGSAEAAARLCLMYLTGQGVARSEQLAQSWYARSVRLGYDWPSLIE